MKISEDHAYTHSTDSLYALFTDSNEVEAKQEALGAREIDVLDCEQDEAGAVVRFVRELPADVPGILSRFLQPWNRVEQSERWQVSDGDSYECELDIDIANVPVTVEGTLELKPTDDGCVNEVRLIVECGIPFVGKALAEFVAADCNRLIADEYEYLVERLSRA